ALPQERAPRPPSPARTAPTLPQTTRSGGSGCSSHPAPPRAPRFAGALPGAGARTRRRPSTECARCSKSRGRGETRPALQEANGRTHARLLSPAARTIPLTAAPTSSSASRASFAPSLARDLPVSPVVRFPASSRLPFAVAPGCRRRSLALTKDLDRERFQRMLVLLRLREPQVETFRIPDLDSLEVSEDDDLLLTRESGVPQLDLVERDPALCVGLLHRRPREEHVPEEPPFLGGLESVVLQPVGELLHVGDRKHRQTSVEPLHDGESLLPFRKLLPEPGRD